MMESRRPATELAGFEIQASSPLEKCSFACHLFLFPVGLIYLCWLTTPREEIGSHTGVYYYPKREYALHVPVTALCLFLAIPFLYAAMNTFTVPKLEYADTVEDVYTKSSSTARILCRKTPSPESSLPEICDLDPSTLVWYSHDPNNHL